MVSIHEKRQRSPLNVHVLIYALTMANSCLVGSNIMISFPNVKQWKNNPIICNKCMNKSYINTLMNRHNNLHVITYMYASEHTYTSVHKLIHCARASVYVFNISRLWRFPFVCCVLTDTPVRQVIHFHAIVSEIHENIRDLEWLFFISRSRLRYFEFSPSINLDIAILEFQVTRMNTYVDMPWR